MAVRASKTSVEEQLAQYRKRKRQEEELTAVKQKLWGYLTAVFTFWQKSETSVTPNTANDGEQQQQQQGEKEDKVPINFNLNNLDSKRRRRKGVREDDTLQEDELPPPPYTRLDWMLLLLKVLMWLLLQKVFILLEFGAVFFIFSAFTFIWYNLRNEPKKKGEASAYSVFNPNCEVLDGTFTAEQFERELLHKM